jgi:vacuolar protein sorting-associated protein 26
MLFRLPLLLLLHPIEHFPPSSYFLRLTILRRMGDITREREIHVHSYRMPPDSNMAIRMEVGIEDCLHIEFEYNKAK